MSLATVRSCALAGVTATPVVVEVHLGGGLPGMTIVGLPQSAVKESKDRVKAAIRHAGFAFPRVKIIVNLAPADLPKRGGRFDLPIALGILVVSGQLSEEAIEGHVAVGELGLGGELRPVEGALPVAQACRANDERLLLPAANLGEAMRCRGVRVRGAGTLVEACAMLAGDGAPPLVESCPDSCGVHGAESVEGEGDTDGGAMGVATSTGGDLSDVAGQHVARRVLEIAAAGEHNLLFCGPPGTGKSMLASRLPGILPPMSEGEATETAAVRSVARAGFDPASWGVRPFRAPHHTVSGIALVGGGVPPHPGEISLAHNGVLFLDELTEFRRAVLEVLREPMESGRIHLSRASHQVEFPARFQLVAAMNPCPCGHHGDGSSRCRCTPDRVLGYRARLSAPFLDRIDLHVRVEREPIDEDALAFLHVDDERGVKAATGGTGDGASGGTSSGKSGGTGDRASGGTSGVAGGEAGGEAGGREDSATVRRRVMTARARQLERQDVANARLGPGALGRHCRVDAAGRALLEQAAGRLGLSLRTVHRTLAVARTIADLAGEGRVGSSHLLEALAYRERVPVDVEPGRGPQFRAAG